MARPMLLWRIAKNAHFFGRPLPALNSPLPTPLTISQKGTPNATQAPPSTTPFPFSWPRARKPPYPAKSPTQQEPDRPHCQQWPQYLFALCSHTRTRKPLTPSLGPAKTPDFSVRQHPTLVSLYPPRKPAIPGNRYLPPENCIHRPTILLYAQ